MKLRVSSGVKLGRLLDKLQQMIDSLLKKFADKGETKKALKHLEKEVGGVG